MNAETFTLDMLEEIDTEDAYLLGIAMSEALDEDAETRKAPGDRAADLIETWRRDVHSYQTAGVR